MGVLNSFYYVGQILATGVSIPLGLLASEYSWRTCLYLQLGPAVINCAGVLFIEESPRWLYARGHRDRAAAILAKYHSKTGDVESPVIKLEMQEIEAAISMEGGDRQFWNFAKVFNSPGNRYRFGLCAMISVWGQLAGNGLITYFLPVLLGLAGITDRNTQRQLNLVNSITSMTGAITGEHFPGGLLGFTDHQVLPSLTGLDEGSSSSLLCLAAPSACASSVPSSPPPVPSPRPEPTLVSPSSVSPPPAVLACN